MIRFVLILSCESCLDILGLFLVIARAVSFLQREKWQLIFFSVKERGVVSNYFRLLSSSY